MYSRTAQDIRRHFERALMRREAEALKQPQDWDRTNEIKTRYQNEIQQQNRLYEREYDTRFEHRLKALIDKAGSQSRNLVPTFAANDRFNGDDLKRQAHREVQFDHQRRISTLRDREASELSQFLNALSQRDSLSQTASRAFNENAERRKAPDRRGMKNCHKTVTQSR